MAVDLMIVGAPKSGTSSLLSYVGAHPAIQAPNQLEMTWFGDPDLYDKPFPEALYYGNAPSDGRLRVGKLAGLMYADEAIIRLRELNPKVRAVAILRDPVTRAYSAYWFHRRRGREPLDRFEDAIRAVGEDDWWSDRFRYLQGGTYAGYVARLFDLLGRDSVDIVVFEEFLADPKAALAPLFERLDLDPSPLGNDVPKENAARVARSGKLAQARRSKRVVHLSRRLLPSGLRGALRQQYRRVNESEVRPPPIDPATERELREHFVQPNRELEELIGRPIDIWQGARR